MRYQSDIPRERPGDQKSTYGILFEGLYGRDTKNRSEELFEKIRALIVTGVLAPGFVFPNENEMCLQLGIGRGTLREAYSSLQAVGLISRNKAEGTYVNDYVTIADKAPFDIVMGLSDFNDIFAFRRMIEGETARFAAMRATEEELDDIAGLLREAKKVIGEHHTLQQHNHVFHRRVSDCAHNQLLHGTFISMQNAFKSLQAQNYYRLKITEPEVVDRAVDEHVRIYEAIRGRDPETAKHLMEVHLEGAFRRTLENLHTTEMLP